METPANPPVALLVDDDETIGMLLSFIVKREGFSLKWVKDGGAALDFVAQEPPPALVLLDVMLPVASGHEILAALRARSEWARVPVLMLTGKTEESEMARAMNAGANGFVVKPFNPQELVSTIRGVVGPASTG